MQATHPKAGFRPQAASIGSGRKSMRDRQLRQNWKVNDGRAAAPRRSEESRERHQASWHLRQMRDCLETKKAASNF